MYITTHSLGLFHIGEALRVVSKRFGIDTGIVASLFFFFFFGEGTDWLVVGWGGEGYIQQVRLL